MAKCAKGIMGPPWEIPNFRYHSIRNFLAHTLIIIPTTAVKKIHHGQRSHRAKSRRSEQVRRKSRGAIREKRPTAEGSQTQRGSSGKQNR